MEVGNVPDDASSSASEPVAEAIWGAAHDALGPALGILVPIDDYDELAFDPDGAYDEDVACWFDDGVDRQAVKRAVEEFYQVLLSAFTDADVPLARGQRQHFEIMSDGSWHVDPIQAFLMKQGEPHLTPQEWVDRKVAIHHARTR
jgi:hypothetical protein